MAFRDGTGRDPTEHPENELTKKHGDSLEKLLDCDVSPVCDIHIVIRKVGHLIVTPLGNHFFEKKRLREHLKFTK